MSLKSYSKMILICNELYLNNLEFQDAVAIIFFTVPFCVATIYLRVVFFHHKASRYQ